MSKIAIFSDVHANTNAFDAFLADAEQAGANRFWFLGDATGRGYEATSTSRRLKRLYDRQRRADRAAWLKGNHDMMMTNELSTEVIGNSIAVSGHRKDVAKIAEDHRMQLESEPELMDWIKKLNTHHHIPPHVYLAHGAYQLEKGKVSETRAYGKYVKSATEVKAQFVSLKEQNTQTTGIIFTGHYHIAMLYRDNDGVVEQIEPFSSECYAFDLTQELVYINPGSIAFPREPDRCPSYVLLETDHDITQVQVRFRRFRYPMPTLPPDYPQYLKEEMERCDENDLRNE